MRRVAEHKRRTIDGEILQVINIYEENVRKKQVEKDNPYSKKHGFLVNRRAKFKFIQE